jgi:O-antigen/teichoic acid export membrane protein
MTSVSTRTAQRGAATWRLPLFRSGHILVVNSAVTAAVGFAFWVVAARLYPPAVVGANATAVSAMMFLAGLAQLNLMSLLLRFVPSSGPRAGRLVACAYLTGGGLSAVAAVVFLLGLRTWAPDLVAVLHGPTAVAYVVATTAWSIFVMQDNVLVGVERPGIVAIENLLFSLAKLALLVPFSAWLLTTGVWYAWSFAAVMAVFGTTAYLFLRAIPRFAARSRAVEQTESLRGFLRYLVPDYIGALAWIAASALVPVLVLDLTDPRHAAAFSLTWQIAFTLFAVPAAFGQSLVAHGAAHTGDAAADHVRVRRHVLRLLAPVSLALIVAAPYLLRLFGPWYESAGTTTMRLVAAAAVPNVVVALAVSHARVTRQMRTVVVTLVSLCVLVLGATVYLVPRVGISGAGWAWLGGETVVAAALLVPRPHVRSRLGGLPTAVVERTVASLADEGWRIEARSATVSDTAVLFARTPDRAAVVKISGSPQGVVLLDRETRALARLRADERLGPWRDLLPERLRQSADGGVSVVVDARLPGRPATPATASTRGLVAAIAPLHHSDRRSVIVSDELLESWVRTPAVSLSAALTARRLPTTGITALVDELESQLAGRRLHLGWTHGDLHPGNVLIVDERITGLIDWSQASDTDLAELDLAFWLLTSGSRRSAAALGRQVARRLRAATPWTPHEQAVLAGTAQIPDRTLLLLTWLRHVAGNLAKSERYAASPLWLRRTVVPVLKELQR